MKTNDYFKTKKKHIFNFDKIIKQDLVLNDLEKTILKYRKRSSLYIYR